MATPNDIQAYCVAEPNQSPPPHVQKPPTNDQTAELDYDFVEQPDQDYFCPVSLELLIEPHQTSCCGHHISQQAANRLIRERKPCPMCKEDNFSTHEDKFFKRNCINKLKVYCPHKKSGCEWTGELGDLNHHTTACPKRPWKCQYCDFESIYEIGPNDHTPNCANYPLPCPNQCEIGTVPRRDADSHLLECPLQLVECEFAGVGCAVKVPRRDLAGHMTENAQHHLMTATLLNLRLTRELHQKMEEKDQQITELKQQLTEHETSTAKLDTKLQKLEDKEVQASEKITEVHQEAIDIKEKLQHQTEVFDAKLQEQAMGLITNQQKIDANGSFLRYSIGLHVGFTCHRLTLTNFKECQAEECGGSWYSEPFYNYPGGYKFQLNIDTNGSSEGSGTHLSAYLNLLPGEYDDERQWPIKVTVRLTMLNQRGDNNHHTSRDVVVEYEEVEHFWCINDKYYPLNRLNMVNFAYLYNDSINFKLELKIKY